MASKYRFILSNELPKLYLYSGIHLPLRLSASQSLGFIYKI